MVSGDDLPVGGRARRHARVLAESGHQVTLHGVLAEGAEPEEDDGPVVLVRTRTERFERPRGIGGVAGFLGARRAWKRAEPLVVAAMQRDAPEVLHALGLEAAAPGWSAAGRAGIAFVYDEPSADAVAALRRPNAAKPKAGGHTASVRKLQKHGAGALAEVLDAPLAGCTAASDAIADALGTRLPSRPVVLRDLPPLRDVPRSDALRVRLGAWTSDRLLVFHAPLADAFGLEAAIRSLVHMEDGCLLAVVGGAWCQDRVQQIADSTGVGPRVRTLPRPEEPDLLRWLASADAAVFPLDPESPSASLVVPREVIDCVHAGLPVVATDGTDAGRLVVAHGLGATAASCAPEAVASALRRIFDTPDAAAAIAAAARRAARDELSWEQERLRLVDLYDRIGGA